MSRILIMAGGTGGHIMPGLAVARELEARGWQVDWLGNPQSMEGRLVPSAGITLHPLDFSGLRGKGWKARLLLPLRLMRALMQARRRLHVVKPDVVLGMGGYVAFPGGVMARLMRLPLVIHEQNAIAGLTNRVLGGMASQTLCAFPEAFGNRLDVECVGNPVRRGFAELAPPHERFADRQGPLRLLVVGGSLGAQALNRIVPAALERIDPARRPQVIHQAGRDHLPALLADYAARGLDADCRDFIDDMPAVMGQADLVICRAGAMTVAEVAAAGVAALFVPLPHAVDDHQTLNARYLADQQAAWLQPQPDLSPEWLSQWLVALDRSQLLERAARARLLARPEAAARIADHCVRLARKDS
jgi:UDP-N-acetylglucosamine--N-acetylmuramyl-(pentapeptide) pyrophosphoryl-undecaprenol N-acetylglucosamine transferase